MDKEIKELQKRENELPMGKIADSQLDKVKEFDLN
jgi:hypothetical protein